jgi:hypothetical protein
MEFNIDPYNDDFELNAKDNNYLRILFKPGYAVQARELTQIQSILQNQIKSFGDHIFADGSPVVGGNLALDNNVTYIKLDETYNNEDIELDQFVGQIILRESDSLVQAKVLTSYYPSGGTPTLMVKYLSGTPFSDGDVFKIAGTTTRAKLIDSSASGFGTIVSINDGIFYVDGFFVKINPQTTVVGAYTQYANVKIGLEVSDDVVDYGVDSTLLDPAQGSFNYQAPGADRYQFNLQLSTRPLDTAVDESKFFELMRLENGAVTKQVKYPIYSEIEKTLARRTFDESGDYTVIPFRASVSDSANDNNYIINIEPGKAYVKGFEFETVGTFRMEVAKPREDGVDSRSLVDIDFDTSFGNYLKFKNVYGSNNSAFINIAELETVDLHCVTRDKANVGNTFSYSNTQIGTAKVRSVKRDIPAQDGVANNDSNGVFSFYFSDITINPIVFQVRGPSNNANTIKLPDHASAQANAYDNVSISVLPVDLVAIPNVTTANVYKYSTRVNANSVTASVFADGNVNIGDTIRVGSDVRQVVYIDASGDWLTVNSAFTKTIEGTNATTDPLYVYIQTDYSSNVTNQVRTIVGYTGSTTKTAFLDRPFDENSVPGANTVVQLNFGIKDLKSFIETDGVKANAHANISVQSLLLDGSTELFETDRKGLIFPLPRSTVKQNSLNNVDYNHLKFAELTGVAGTFTYNLESYESIPWSLTNSNLEDNLIAVVRECTPSGNIANGVVYPLTTNDVVITPGLGGGIQITTPSSIAKLDIYCTVKINDAEDILRTKTLRSNTSYSIAPFNYPVVADLTVDHTVTLNSVDTVKINVAEGMIWVVDANVTNIFPGDSINLYVPDVVRVRKILAGNTTDQADATNFQDVTDSFVIDYGQNDEIYDHCRLILRQGYPSPNAQLTVHCDMYTHDAGGITYFSVDSYDSTIYEDGNIPVYNSPNGGSYFLRDCLDFRAVRRIASPTIIDTPKIPAPDASCELSFDYYLPRIDKLVLTKNKEFRLIKGVSAPQPVPPDDTDDSMTLYTIYLPPFVARIDDIRMRFTENRRYTMRDIAQIDKRVQAMEYYTALNNIESMAMNDDSKYEDGTDKAKFGIIGEGFKNFNIADYLDPDFNVTMEEGSMTPYVNNRAYGLKLLSTSGVNRTTKTLSLGYTEEVMVEQPVTSNKLISVQPFLFAQFVGDVKLSPDMDYWVSETLKPDVLRAPEIDGRVREIFNAERIANQIAEASATITVPTPTSNASNLITTSPGSDPPVSNTIFTLPVIIPTPAPVIQPQPTPVSTTTRSIFDALRTLITVKEPAPQPTITPVPTSTTSTITATSGGGGCVALESYIPWVEGQVWNHSEIRQAYQLQDGFKVVLANETNLAIFVGEVRKSAIELQPCVRVTTEDGTSLVCSTTAPLPTLQGVTLAPDVLGKAVAVFKDGLAYWNKVVSVEDVGTKFVRVIDAHNNSFWAGEKEGAYILHHNMAMMTTVKKF